MCMFEEGTNITTFAQQTRASQYLGQVMNPLLLFRQTELVKTSPAYISSLAATCLLRVIHTFVLPDFWTGHLDLTGSVPHPYN